jgi:hypothetical protein
MQAVSEPSLNKCWGGFNKIIHLSSIFPIKKAESMKALPFLCPFLMVIVDLRGYLKVISCRNQQKVWEKFFSFSGTNLGKKRNLFPSQFNKKVNRDIFVSKKAKSCK